jgi:hypothetical protein
MPDTTTLVASQIFDKSDLDATIQAWVRSLAITTWKWSWVENISNTQYKLIIAYV